MFYLKSSIGSFSCSNGIVLSTEYVDGASLWYVFTLTEGARLTTGVSMIVEIGVVDLTTRLG